MQSEQKVNFSLGVFKFHFLTFNLCTHKFDIYALKD